MPKRRLHELEEAFNSVVNLIKLYKIGDASPKLLQILGNALDCDWGTYWEVDPELHRLRPIATWSAPDIKATDLETDTRSRTLSLSEGTSGHVWRSRKPIWTLDLVKDMCLPRSLDADNAGLHGGIWFAIKTDKTVYAVVELLGKKLITPTEELLVGIESFGINLGYLLEAKQ